MTAVTAALGRLIVVEPRARASFALGIVVSLVSILAALAVGAVLLTLTGHSASEVYRAMYDGAVATPRNLSRTLNLTTPLILTGLAVAVAFRMRIWSIGAEGQFLAGAIAGSGVALALGDGTSGWVVIGAAILASMLGGAIWALFAGIPRALLGTDEVLTTLMLNFVAIYLVSFLIFGSQSFWRDQEQLARPQGARLPEAAGLPELFERANAGIILAVAVAVCIWLLFTWSRLGFEVEVVGSSVEAGRYAGIPLRAVILIVFAVSGALAGLAGGLEVTNETQALDPDRLNQGLGYAGIVVAALARLNFLAIVPVAFLLAVLLNSATSLSILGIPPSVVTVLQGLILLFVAAGQFHIAYRVRRPGIKART
jgi:ABC-type uncharacterized transport system permease subunit